MRMGTRKSKRLASKKERCLSVETETLPTSNHPTIVTPDSSNEHDKKLLSDLINVCNETLENWVVHSGEENLVLRFLQSQNNKEKEGWLKQLLPNLRTEEGKLYYVNLYFLASGNFKSGQNKATGGAQKILAKAYGESPSTSTKRKKKLVGQYLGEGTDMFKVFCDEYANWVPTRKNSKPNPILSYLEKEAKESSNFQGFWQRQVLEEKETITKPYFTKEDRLLLLLLRTAVNGDKPYSDTKKLICNALGLSEEIVDSMLNFKILESHSEVALNPIANVPDPIDPSHDHEDNQESATETNIIEHEMNELDDNSVAWGLEEDDRRRI